MAVNAYLAPVPLFRDWDNQGNPLVGGKLYTYAAGTNTPLASWADYTATIANMNPVILNARGEAPVYLLPNVAYKLVLQDSFGNLIWSVDQVLNSQLLTLYAGVDSGSANAYVLNFVSNFTALSNGIILYFVASNTNTGASTLSVNGLGAVPLLNQSGAALQAGQVVAGTMTGVIYYNGNWEVLTTVNSVPTSGSFLVTPTGGSFSPAVGTATWVLNGSQVNLFLPCLPGTSNATSFTYTGLPSSLQPLSQTFQLPIAVAQNNSAFVAGVYAQIGPGSGTIVFGLLGSASGWTASGSKEIGQKVGSIYQGVFLTYTLT